MEHLRYAYGPLEGRTAYTAYYSATVVKLTNHDFPCPAQKIAIGSLSTSALAALKLRLTTSLEHRLESSLDGTSGEISYVFSFVITVSLKQLRRLCTGGSIFQVPPVSDYSTCCTNRVLTRLVHQVRVYAFGAPTTCL